MYIQTYAYISFLLMIITNGIVWINLDAQFLAVNA